MESILSQAKAFIKTADEASRKKLLDGLRELTLSVETDQDALQRILHSQMQLAVVRVGCDVKLFDALADSTEPCSVATLSEKTGVAPLLMARILRYLASFSYITETGKDTFAANKLTKLLTNEGVKGGVYHHFDSLGPAMQALPDYLKEHNYKEVDNVVDCPLQKGHSTDLPAFLWVQTKPDNFRHFNNWMMAQRMGLNTWLDKYPYQEKVKAVTSPEQPLFVDVGGGLGHQSVALRQAVPHVPNKVILQDMEVVLEHAIKHPGVEIVPQDFWKPQPDNAKGAKMYYLRNILHDYPDEKALDLLQNIKAVLAPDSVILIDEMIVPNSGAHWHATQLDLTMMCALASLERTEEQWYSLMAKAGLKIQNVYTYTETLRDSIIECVAA